MRWSRALSAGLALTAAALAIKAAALGRPEPIDDRAVYLRTLGHRLAAHGFAVTRNDDYVVARRGACRLKARNLPPGGNEALAYAQLGAGFGPSRYAWRGAWRAAPPKIAPLLLFFTQRELARIGVVMERPAISAVAAGPGCAGLPASLFGLSIVQR